MLYTYINGIKKYLVLPKVEPAFIASYKNGNILNLCRVPLDGSSTDSHIEYNCPFVSPFILYDDKIKKIIIAHPNKTTIDNDLSIVVSVLDPNTLNIQQTFSSPFWEPGTSYNNNILSYVYNPVKHILTVCQSNKNNASSAHLIIYDLLNFKVFTKTIEFNNGNSLRVISSYWLNSTNKLRIAVINDNLFTLNTSTNQYDTFSKFYIYDVNITSDETNITPTFFQNGTTFSTSEDLSLNRVCLDTAYSSNNIEQNQGLFFRLPSSYENYQFLSDKAYFYNLEYNFIKSGAMNSYNVITSDESPMLNAFGTTGFLYNSTTFWHAFSKYWESYADGNNKVQYNLCLLTPNSTVVNGNATYGAFVNTNRDNPNNESTGNYRLFSWNTNKCYLARDNFFYINDDAADYAKSYRRYALSFIYTNYLNYLNKELFIYDSKSGNLSDMLPMYYGGIRQYMITYSPLIATTKKYLGVMLYASCLSSLGNVRYVNIIDNDNLNQNDIIKLDCWQNSNLIDVDFRPATVVY